MSAAPEQAPSWLDRFKGLNGERLLQWLAQTAEEAMGLDYELNKIRAASEDPA
jgi:hypothetical protein